MEQLVNQLEGEFHVLSRFVHVQNRTFIRYRRMPRTLTSADSGAVSMFRTRSRELWPLLISILIVFFPLKFVRCNKNEIAVIRASAGPTWGTRIAKHLRVISTP